MKKIIIYAVLIFCIISISFNIKAQSPEKFNYQAIVRNASGQILANQPIKLRIKIHDQIPDGTIIYVELYTKTTNAYGLLNLEIGSGPAFFGVFSEINWSSGEKYLEVQMEENGGIKYISIGTMQILSVPYALFAKNVENNNDPDSDTTNELQNLVLKNRSLSITKRNTVTLNDNDSTNELQTLSLNANNLTISKRNTIALPYLTSQWWSNNGAKIYYNAGNVGIGTSNPANTLDIYSGVNAYAGISTTSNVGFAGLFINKGAISGMTNGFVTFQTGGLPKWHLGMIKDDNFAISRNEVVPDGTFYIDGLTSRIGMGTTSPGVNLDIRSPNSTFIRVGASDTGGWSGIAIDKGSSTNYSNGAVVYMTNGSFKWFSGLLKSNDYQISKSWAVPDGTFFIKDTNGYVGIGTTNPQTRLDIQDTVAAYVTLKGSSPAANAGLFLNRGANTAATISSVCWQTNAVDKWFAGLIKTDNFAISRDGNNPDGTFSINYTTGNTGIGTANPTTRLDIRDNLNAVASLSGAIPTANAGVIINRGITSASTNGLITYQTGTVNKWYAGLIKSDNFTISRSSVTSDGAFFINFGTGYTGIGTITPVTRLDIRDNTSAVATLYGASNTANAGVTINRGSTSASTNAVVTFQTGSADRWYAGLIKEDNFSISRSSGASDGTFYINRASGYTGIGTFNPVYKLDIRDNTQAYASLLGATATANAGLYINKGATTASTNAVVTFLTGSTAMWYAGTIRSDNFAISRSIVSADGTFYIVKSTGYVGINTTNPRNGLQINQNIRIPGFPTRYVSTTDNYGTQIRQNSVYFLIDKIDSSANPTPTSLIDIDLSQATIPFQPWVNNNINNGSATFAWKYVYGVNAFQQTSDVRLKKDIEDLNLGLNAVLKLRPVSFHWLNDSEAGRKIGFIAQDVEKIVPEVVQHTVYTDEQLNRWKAEGRQVPYQDVYSMGSSDMIPILVKAIQEQQQMINNLQIQVKELEKKQGK